MTYDLHNTECLAFMAEMPAASVDLILADPPYMTTNLHFDKAPALAWPAWWQQAWRVLKPAGVVVLFAADLFTVDLILSQRQHYRYRLVWEKSNATGFLRAKKQPLKAHEDILVFGRNGDSSTYNPQKVAHQGRDRSRRDNHTNQAQHYTTTKRSTLYVDDGQRYPRSVMYHASVGKLSCLHPTEKPVALLAELVRTYSNPGDVVLDCFAGSGSTLEACLLEGRHGVGCELNADYYTKAQARLRALTARPQLDFATPAPASAPLLGREKELG